jgi:hypothetical protein
LPLFEGNPFCVRVLRHVVHVCVCIGPVLSIDSKEYHRSDSYQPQPLVSTVGQWYCVLAHRLENCARSAPCVVGCALRGLVCVDTFGSLDCVFRMLF